MTPTAGSPRFAIVVLAVALVSLAAGALLWQARLASQGSNKVLITYPEPRAVADFALIDHDGNDFSLDGFRGRWSVLFFGFTHCPDICPTTLFQMQQARGMLAEELPADALPGMFLVSVDPERDSPAKLRQYTAHFGPGIDGLSGDPAQLTALARQLGIAFHVQPHEPGATDYLVDHSAALILLDPTGRLHGVFPAPHDPEAIAHDLLRSIRRG